jgi:hypothetical protein
MIRAEAPELSLYVQEGIRNRAKAPDIRMDAMGIT